MREPISDMQFLHEGLVVISWRSKVARWRRPGAGDPKIEDDDDDDTGSESVFGITSRAQDMAITVVDEGNGTDQSDGEDISGSIDV